MAPVCFHQRVDFNLSEYYFVNTDPKEQTRREHQEGNSITLKKVIYKPVPTLWSRSRPFKVLRPSEHRNKLLKTYLVTTNNVVETVRVAEGVRHIWTKLTTDTAFWGCASTRLHGVGPQDFAHQPAIRGLAVALNAAYIVQTYVVGTEEATVHSLRKEINRTRQTSSE